MDLFNPYNSIDTLTADALGGAAQSVPLGESCEPAAAPVFPPQPVESGQPDAWSENFARSLQDQHSRVRQFLQAHAERWRKMVAHFTRQVENLQATIAGLTADNDVLREQAEQVVEVEPRVSMTDVQARPSRPASTGLARVTQSLHSDGNDWESQKRRMLAELESDDAIDVESTTRRMEIKEVIERTDRIIAEKDREIEELKHLLDSQSGSVGSLAVGAAALEQIFDQDEIIREERQRLQQAQEELRGKLRQSEIDHAMERARLARREAEVEERLRNGEPNGSGGDNEALAPTGRPVRGRWRTQLGLGGDE